MRKYFLLFCGGLILFFACQEEQVIEIPLPYKNIYVVSAELQANTNFKGIRISKTIPLTENFSNTNTVVEDAIVYLRIDSLRIIPLKYSTNKYYKPLEPFTIDRGQYIEVFINVENKDFYASTHIPKDLVVSNPKINNKGQLEALVLAEENSVYSALWYAQNTNGPVKKATSFESINRSSKKDFISVNTSPIPQDILKSDSLYIQIIAFDKQYWDYFETRENNKPIEDIFASSGGSVVWNVRGDNVIGLVIGTNYSMLISVK